MIVSIENQYHIGVRMRHEQHEKDFLERFLQSKKSDEIVGYFLSRYTVAGLVALATLIVLTA